MLSKYSRKSEANQRELFLWLNVIHYVGTPNQTWKHLIYAFLWSIILHSIQVYSLIFFLFAVCLLHFLLCALLSPTLKSTQFCKMRTADGTVKASSHKGLQLTLLPVAQYTRPETEGHNYTNPQPQTKQVLIWIIGLACPIMFYVT